MRVADVLVRQLSDNGVELIFALSGNQIMPVFDATLDSSISIVHTRHEAAAVYMAEGYAQISGKTGVALVTAGVGMANAIGPLLCAQASQTPLLLISGDSPVSLDGRGAFQETPQCAMTAAITKASVKTTDANTFQALLQELLTLAVSGQPGPVHLSVPVDVLNAEIPYRAELTGSTTNRISTTPVPVQSWIEPALGEALHQAQQPLIILGPGMRATHKLCELETLNAPVVLMESPRGANDPGLGNFQQAWKRADLVIVIGKPIDFSLGFGDKALWPNAQWVCAYGDEQECNRAERNLASRLIKCIHGEPTDFAAQLIATSNSSPARTQWNLTVATWIKQRQVKKSASNLPTSSDLCSAVQSLLTEANDSILICDGGEFGQWAQSISSAQRRIVNGISGAIGGSLCHAIGAKAASPDSNVIALMGDGTVGFHLSEFETALRADFPILVVIGNDKRWNAEHLLQQRLYGDKRTHSCELSDARYDLAVQALGGFGAYVTQTNQLDGVLHDALHCGRTACVNVVIEGLGAPVFDL